MLEPDVGSRLSNFAMVVSSILFFLFAIAWFAASRIDPRTQHVAVPGGFVSLGTPFRTPSVVFFNDAINGPYLGGIIGISSTRHVPNRIALDRPIYFRHFRLDTGEALWTLLVSLYYPLAAAAVLPGVWLIRRRRRRSRGFEVALPPATG